MNEKHNHIDKKITNSFKQKVTVQIPLELLQKNNVEEYRKTGYNLGKGQGAAGMKRMNITTGNHFLIKSDLYVLKHKDLDVAMVKVDGDSGKIEYVLDVYMPDARAKVIAQSVGQKIEYLQLFCQGRKIWKREMYW